MCFRGKVTWRLGTSYSNHATTIPVHRPLNDPDSRIDLQAIRLAHPMGMCVRRTSEGVHRSWDAGAVTACRNASEQANDQRSRDVP